MATKKRSLSKRADAGKAPAAKRPLKTMTKRHAKALVERVNGLLAEHGFSAKVSELHFVPSGADSMGCVNCNPPSVCKRVCFINDHGVPECENRCVPPQ